MNIDPVLYLKHKLLELTQCKNNAIDTKTKIYYQKLITKYRKAIKLLNEKDNTETVSRTKTNRGKVI